MYWFNRTELITVSEELTKLDFKELKEIYQQNLEKVIRIARQNDEYLS